MGKKGRVREVPQSRCIVGHRVDDTRDMGDFREVTVVALMKSKDAQEVGGRTVVGDRSFLDPGDGRGVVTQRRQGEFPAVGLCGDNVLVTYNAGEFQVGVGDGPVGVGKAHERVLDIAWKGLAPYHRRDGFGRQGRCRWRRRNPNAAHARASSIACTDMGWFGRNDFSNACRTIAKALC
jgi:hypothetical protein